MTTESSPHTNITQAHRDMFHAITSGEFDNVALFSCFVNGEPAAAIVAIHRDAQDGDFLITPLFVSLTGSMLLTDHEGIAVTSTGAPA